VFRYVVFIHASVLRVFEILNSSSVPVRYSPRSKLFSLVLILADRALLSASSPSLYNLIVLPSYVRLT